MGLRDTVHNLWAIAAMRWQQSQWCPWIRAKDLEKLLLKPILPDKIHLLESEHTMVLQVRNGQMNRRISLEVPSGLPCSQ